MGPKKKGKGKDKKAEGPEEGAPMTAEDQVKYLGATNQSLILQLQDRTQDVSAARADKHEYQEKFDKITAEFEEEKKSAFEITRDMTRQYKGMQEQLVDRITQLSRTVQSLEDKIEEQELHLEQTVRYVLRRWSLPRRACSS